MKRLLIIFTLVLMGCVAPELETQPTEYVDSGCSPWRDSPDNPGCQWRDCGGQIETDCLD